MSGAKRSAVPLLIVFVDLSRFAAMSERVEDTVIAEVLDAYYDVVARAVSNAGGTLVKFIGDAALAVFPEAGIDAAIRELLQLKRAVDALMAEHGWESTLSIKAHFATVIAGQFGPADDRRFDVIGRGVNTAAMLKSAGFAMSASAFEKLSPALRAAFRAQVPATSYVHVDDPAPFRR